MQIIFQTKIKEIIAPWHDECAGGKNQNIVKKKLLAVAEKPALNLLYASHVASKLGSIRRRCNYRQGQLLNVYGFCCKLAFQLLFKLLLLLQVSGS